MKKKPGSRFPAIDSTDEVFWKTLKKQKSGGTFDGVWIYLKSLINKKVDSRQLTRFFLR